MRCCLAVPLCDLPKDQGSCSPDARQTMSHEARDAIVASTGAEHAPSRSMLETTALIFELLPGYSGRDLESKLASSVIIACHEKVQTILQSQMCSVRKSVVKAGVLSHFQAFTPSPIKL